MDRWKCSKSLKTFVSHTKAYEEESNPEKAFLNEVRQDDVSRYELASLLSPLVPEMVAMHGPTIMGPFPPRLPQWLNAQFVSIACVFSIQHNSWGRPAW